MLFRSVEQLMQEVEGLKLGVAYEAISDAAIMPRTKEEMLARDIQPFQQPFYPMVTGAPSTEQLYVGRENVIGRDLGFEKIARDAYNDIIAGKIPIDQVKNLTVEKYVRKGVEQRRLKEAEEETEETFNLNEDEIYL